MARGGRERNRTEPERRCIVTGESQPKSGLIRFVVSPDGAVIPDVAGRLPGRGIWVCADREALRTAARKGLFARAARARVDVPDNLEDMVEGLLVRRLIELIALARKAGEAVAGFEKVKDWLATGRVKVLFQATDGSERGKGKLWTPEGARWFGCLSAAELGLAFGREFVVHGAVGAGGLAPRIVQEATRLAGLRGIDGGRSAGKETKSA